MQSRNIVEATHNTADGCQDSCQADDGVESGHRLREVGGRNALADEKAWIALAREHGQLFRETYPERCQ